jgi:hypothetical protein
MWHERGWHNNVIDLGREGHSKKSMSLAPERFHKERATSRRDYRTIFAHTKVSIRQIKAAPAHLGWSQEQLDVMSVPRARQRWRGHARRSPTPEFR